MIIIGISGHIGSGKSTLAELLTTIDADHSVHLETSTVVCELGDIFNTALAEHLSELGSDRVTLGNTLIATLLPTVQKYVGRRVEENEVAIAAAEAEFDPQWYEKLWVYFDAVKAQPELVKSAITPTNKPQYRALLQWIGIYFLYKLDPLLWYKELVHRIGKLEETKAITFAALTAPRQPAEAEFVQQIGGKVILIERSDIVSDQTDATEKRVSEIIPDIHVNNNGSLQDLQLLAARIRQDLESNTTYPIYSAR